MITKFKIFENNNILPIGTTVRVLPKLKEFIEKHHLNNNWNKIIGKILYIEQFFPNYDICKEDIYVLNTPNSKHFGFIVPIDCVEKIEIDRTLSENDPYGEEDWNNDDIYTFEKLDIVSKVKKLFENKLFGFRDLDYVDSFAEIFEILSKMKRLGYIDRDGNLLIDIYTINRKLPEFDEFFDDENDYYETLELVKDIIDNYYRKL